MPIQMDAQGWALELTHSAYVLGLDSAGRLVHRYWGPRLPRTEDYPSAPVVKAWASFNGEAHLTLQEYPVYGGPDYTDPCLKLRFHDGVRDVVLRFESAETPLGDVPELCIHLRDEVYPLRVSLHYRLHEAHDLIERWVTLHNLGDAPIHLERVFSAQWHLPPGRAYTMRHMTGRWLDEWHMHRTALPEGITAIESRRMATSHHAHPWFSVDAGHATEDQGEVWFGLLAWSGSWKINAERTQFDHTRLNIGWNDWDFAFDLAPGEQLHSAASLAGYSDAGYGAASRRLHGYIRQHLPHPQQIRPVLYNSWEATYFDVDARSQAEYARIAASLGVELFVMDDGWFHGRHSDMAGLGDWWPDEGKFPQGLQPLIDEVKSLGMQFGLWVEPEMVSPDSDLYRAHPDWVIHYATRPATTLRNQLMLNLARTDVQDYIIAKLDALLSQHDIRFIKWDFNRNVSEPGWPGAPGEAREIWLRYVWGMYRVWGTLRDRHPNVIWQTCSGGGGRVDPAMLRLADQAWISDNTEPAARIRMQAAFSEIYPPDTMEAWVTDMGPAYIPLAFRFHVSMAGVLGIGADITEWGEEQKEIARACVSQYKAIRHIVQRGQVYRLVAANESGYWAHQVNSEDGREGILFAYRTHISQPGRLLRLRLRGLDPQTLYSVEGQEGIRSGAAWAHSDIVLELADYESRLLHIRRVD